MDTTRIHDLAVESRRVLDVARFQTRATDPDQAWSEVGSISDYLAELVVLSDQPDPAPPAPTPTPLPPTTAALPPNGGVFAPQKWLPGSLGCDVFLPRGTRIPAPWDCVVEEVIGGQGISGGAELIIARPDKSEAQRWRHCQALSGIRVGMAVLRGQDLAQVLDTSLDSLGALPAWAGPMPDHWQHWDLSYNVGSDQFAPTGGGGGNRSAYQWLIDNGYQGRILARTPGPPDAGVGMAEAITMMMPACYREIA